METDILDDQLQHWDIYMGATSVPSFLLPLQNIHKFPSISLCSQNFSKSRAKNANLSYISQVKHSQKAAFKSSGCMRRGRVVVGCSAKNSGPPEDHTALETVLKLYEAIKNKNVHDLSDIIAEECLCISNFVSTSQLFHGKKQVLAFFASLMKNLGNNIQFVVQPTLEDGMVVCVSWKLEWNHVPLPLGKGFSFYLCHVYQGKVMIKNVEIFMEPLLHIEPVRLKLITLATTATEKLNPRALYKNKARRAMIIFFILLCVAAVVFLLKHRLSR